MPEFTHDDCADRITDRISETEYDGTLAFIAITQKDNNAYCGTWI